jgi:hypothetical protein
MNLTRDQETFVKMSSQALLEWRESLGAWAWVVLGVVLVFGIVLLIAAVRWVFRGSLLSHRQPSAMRGLDRP